MKLPRGASATNLRAPLLLSPFRARDRVFRSNFPVRNRVMAAISDATVIIEASDTSGTLAVRLDCRGRRRSDPHGLHAVIRSDDGAKPMAISAGF
ncbi:DNA-processing protein DprA [Bradyrhizobium sp. RDI18]|uniref:DNA-processing protein DprA n=1 Tax=Bradyrhizobium sp. RDI18 TaxID=3367400 RepID=UPI003721CA18